MQPPRTTFTFALAFAFAFALLSSFVFAQKEDSGAKPPKVLEKLGKKEGQYKRIHQVALRMLETDQPTEAKKILDSHLKDNPRDAESLFMLGVFYANQNDVPQAINHLKLALKAGLPAGRIIAGPRDLLAKVHDETFFQELVAEKKHEPIQGPLLGNVTDQQATVWLRTTQACPVRLHVSLHPDMRDAIASPPSSSTEESDFTAKPTVQKLTPNTKYYYQIEIDGQRSAAATKNQFFTTFRTTGTKGKLRLAFGGGAGYVPHNERMWNTIFDQSPEVLLLLGDNVYIDDPKSITQQRYTYYRRQSRPEYQKLTAVTPTFTIWDDHDFGTNDCWGGPKIKKPAWKFEKAWPIYRQNWPNPGFAGGEEQPGCWYAFSVGDIDFVMLDCRYYRTAPGAENPSMLGPVQMAWLKETLPKLKGTFKVICSSVPWEYRTKGKSTDTWNGYQNERDEIFGFLNTQKTKGVILMSADRHRSDAWKIANSEGYDFYEFNSSRLTNQHVHPEMKQAIFSYNKKQSFGRVLFDTEAEDPTATYTVINIDGEEVHDLVVKLSDLK